MKLTRLFYLFLIVSLLCGISTQCGENHAAPPPLSGDGGDDGKDDGDDDDDIPGALAGYPKGLSVVPFTDDLPGGSKCLGFYAVVDFAGNPGLIFRPQWAAAKKPTEYFSAFKTSGGGTPQVVINGGFFGGTTSVSLLIDNNSVKSPAARSDVIGSVTYYPVRAALGQMTDGSFEAVWVYCMSGGNIPYAYPSALDNNEKTKTFMSEPPTPATPGARRWNAQYAIGAGPMLVYGGANVAEENYWKEVFDSGGVAGLARHPRTAIGFTADKKLILLVCDGRTKRGSAGFTLPELAGKLIALGCTYAINLDGGGSSTFVGKEGKVLNMPSDTAGTTLEGATIVERKIPTAVVIAEK